jgi:hypothetical protein
MSLPSGLREDKLATMGTDRPRKAARHLRIRVSDMASGHIKADLRLPLGLVNTVLHAGGRLAADLDGYDPQALQELIARSSAEAGVQTLDTDGDERLEVSVE